RAERAKLKADQKKRRAAFAKEELAKRAAFLKDNPEIAARWAKEKARRDAAKARCEKDPSCRKRPRAGPRAAGAHDGT
ncbi:MAG: hypothetical protein KGL53_11930, partial [Elusimicrobia bacterium]|nr:hypothetical protein [Elusimicrobiota bacterium]